MAYSTLNPPRMLVDGVGTMFGKRWVYQSSDALSDVDTDSYFSNGYDLGMRVGDIVDAQTCTYDAGDTLQETPLTVTAAGTLVVLSASATTGVDCSNFSALPVTDSD